MNDSLRHPRRFLHSTIHFLYRVSFLKSCSLLAHSPCSICGSGQLLAVVHAQGDDVHLHRALKNDDDVVCACLAAFVQHICQLKKFCACKHTFTQGIVLIYTPTHLGKSTQTHMRTQKPTPHPPTPTHRAVELLLLPPSTIHRHALAAVLLILTPRATLTRTRSTTFAHTRAVALLHAPTPTATLSTHVLTLARAPHARNRSRPCCSRCTRRPATCTSARLLTRHTRVCAHLTPVLHALLVLPCQRCPLMLRLHLCAW